MDEIRYSDGSVIKTPVVQIWPDLHSERAGFYRAFWCESPESESGSPVIGYCSPGGSHRSIRATAAEVLRLYPGTKIFRNGREVIVR